MQQTRGTCEGVWEALQGQGQHHKYTCDKKLLTIESITIPSTENCKKPIETQHFQEAVDNLTENAYPTSNQASKTYLGAGNILSKRVKRLNPHCCLQSRDRDNTLLLTVSKTSPVYCYREGAFEWCYVILTCSTLESPAWDLKSSPSCALTRGANPLRATSSTRAVEQATPPSAAARPEGRGQVRDS